MDSESRVSLISRTRSKIYQTGRAEGDARAASRARITYKGLKNQVRMSHVLKTRMSHLQDMWR